MLRAIAALLAVLVLALPRAATAAELFRLDVDPTLGATPFSDATGRHTLTTGGLSGGVVATDVLTPDGGNAALFSGGWLRIASDGDSAGDFLFGPDQDLTFSFWFKSPGNGAAQDTAKYPDRMHAAGFGDASNNLDVDLGDSDASYGVWTYFGGQGSNNVVDTPPLGRNHFLDDEWHLYRMIRREGLVSVYVDGALLGTTPYAGALGSTSAGARNYIGRASVLTDNVFYGAPGSFAWHGYIGGFGVYDTALPPVDVPEPCTFALLAGAAVAAARRARR